MMVEQWKDYTRVTRGRQQNKYNLDKIMQLFYVLQKIGEILN